ncbi:MAG: hypothetical protein IH989_03725, partial [Planctomycetes bacterium]|nr:hypothetical protein [Planctomycetota bacterium]
SCYSFGYLWLRDRPGIAYNYIEQQNASSGELPDSTAGWRAKLDRVAWQASGRQFRSLMGTTRLQARIKLLWLRHELAPPQRQDILAIVILIVIFGAVITRRRCVAALAILSGMVAGALAFVFLYQVYGQAADFLPLLFSAAVFAGVALSSVIPGHAGRAGTSASIGLFVLAAVLNVTHVSYGLRAGFELDATEFLEQLDMETLPRRAVIVADWSRSTPLRYAKHVLTKRDDIDIIINAGRWQERIAALPLRPAFAAIPDVVVDGFTLVPFRNIKRLERIQLSIP